MRAITKEDKMGRRRSSLRIGNNLGMLLLAVWLILSGLTVFIPSVRNLGQLFPYLALAAGVLILIDR